VGLSGVELPPASWQARAVTRGRSAAILLGVRDLQWRLRRFAIAVVASGLALALALLLSGVSSGFDNEARRTVASFGADAWLVRSGSVGPFTAPAPFPAAWVGQVRRLPGVRAADPVAIFSATTSTPHVRTLSMAGVVPGGVGSRGAGADRVARGRAVVDGRLGLDVGDTLLANGRPFTVAGLTHGRTVFAATPTAVVTLADLQQVVWKGLPLATAVVLRGVPRSVPPRFTLLTNGEVREDLGRPVASAKQTISLISWLLWLVAGSIIGALLYLSALERLGQFAVLKATGVATRTLVAALLLQAVVAALAAAALAVALEELLAPAAAMPVEVSGTAYLILPLVSVAIAVVASLAALRRVVRVDPALAFAAAR
jgi:putative ABC transport system permease protein